jgi:hypothetical protein
VKSIASVSATLDEPTYEAVIALLLAGGGAEPVDASAIARELHVSTERALRLMREAPPEVVGRVRVGRAVHWVAYVGPEPRAEFRAMLATIAHARALRSRRPPLDAADAASDAIGRARRRLLDGDVRGAARIVRERGLNAHALLPLVPARRRSALAAELALLKAESLLAVGDAPSALAACARAERAAVGAPWLLPRIFATQGAALRIAGPRHLAAARDAYDRAMCAIRGAPTEQRPSLERWIYAAGATPLLVVGQAARAIEALTASRDRLDGADATGAAETYVLEARTWLVAGAPDRAEEAVSLASQAAGRAERWVLPWVHRTEADIIVANGEPRSGMKFPEEILERWARAFDRAWWPTDGFGFQRDLLLARLAALGANARTMDVLGPRLARSVLLAIAARHRERRGSVLAACPACRWANAGDRARHALGPAADRDLSFWR